MKTRKGFVQGLNGQAVTTEEQIIVEEPIPDGLSPTELMARKLLTNRGHRLYKIRGKTVEKMFGQIEDARGFDKFMRRGFEACRSEWSLICATHNLLKLWRSGKACWI